MVSPRRPTTSAAKRRRRSRRRRALLAALAVLVMLAGYVYLDIEDVLPGPLTRLPPWQEAEPFPQYATPPGQDLAALAPTAAADAPSPTEAALAQITAPLIADSRLGPSPSVVVTDAQSGQTLLAENAQQVRAPASTMKVLTAVAALEAMGPRHRFTTSVVADDDGEVVLIGGGDIALGADAGSGEDVRGYAGMGDLADQVADSLDERGLGEVDLGLDDSLFTGPEMARTWDDIDIGGGWAMPIHPLAVNLGRQEGTNVRSPDPAMAAAQVFANLLEERGIEVGDIRRQQTDSEDLLGAVYSAELADIVTYNIHYSDNPLADVLARMVAVESGYEGSFDGAEAAIIDVLNGMGVDTTGTEMVDASGLSAANRVSAQALTDTVYAAMQEPHLGDVVRALPVGGLEGTLAARMRDTPASGLVAAKTGTLPSVVSLTGTAHTTDGRLLAFTVMASGFDPGAYHQAREAVDDWTAQLAACGCS